MLFFLFLHKYPGEGKDHFQAKPCQSICPRETLDRTCVWEARVRTSYPPRYLLCLCMCGLSSRENRRTHVFVAYELRLAKA